jgi:CBS domain-containing protein
MNSQDVGALLVMDRSLLDVDGDERVTEAEFRASPQTSAMRGIVTERDYLRAVARGAVSPGTAVGDIMTDFATDNGAGLISASPDTSVLAAMEIMTEARIRHIPCIAPPSRDGPTGAVMEGMVCIGDVIKALLAEEREEVQICRDFINGVYD